LSYGILEIIMLLLVDVLENVVQIGSPAGCYKNETNRGKYIEVGGRQYITMVIFLLSRDHGQISRVVVTEK